MKLRIKFFASLRERTGVAELDLECADPMTVATLRRELGSRFGDQAFAGSLIVSVNWEPAEAGRALRDGDEVAFLPPMSGGSDGPEGPEVPRGAGADKALSNDAFWISPDAIDQSQVEARVRAPGYGGVVTFVGTVRDHARGKSVVRLEYEAYPGMAEKKMREIGDEIAKQWPGVRVAIAHRVGTLGIGDVAVAIAVAAPHRVQAFEACRFAIDRLKQTVPIWKKEFTSDGEHWVEHNP